jgi:hypothetical protein
MKNQNSSGKTHQKPIFSTSCRKASTCCVGRLFSTLRILRARNKLRVCIACMPCCVKTGLATGPCRNLEEPKLTLVDGIKRVVRTIYILFSSSEIPIAKEDQEILDLADLSTPLPEDLAAYTSLYENSGFRYPLKMPYR